VEKTIRPLGQTDLNQAILSGEDIRMFDEFDREMAKRKLTTVLVTGESTLGSPELAYATRTVIPRGGIFVKRHGCAPFLVVSNIDIGNARRGRVRNVLTYGDLKYETLLKRHGKDRGYVLLIDRILQRARSRGRIGIYSRNEFSRLLFIVEALRTMGHNIRAETDPSILESLRETKGTDEVDKICRVGVKATQIVRSIRGLLAECTISAGKVRLGGRKLTVGNVKSRINIMLAEQGLMAPEGTVFAAGKSSADPHGMGNPLDPIRAGVPIVLDLFPVAPDGYWFDLTRTLVVGKASRTLRRLFDIVLEVQLRSLDSVREGASASGVMHSACDMFEAHGFKTIRDTLRGDRDAAKVGFIHSLGHGVGLTIGERPYLSLFSDETLRSGHVVTVEPGLYDPRIGGVRIEDTVLVKGRGIENLTRLEKELEI